MSLQTIAFTFRDGEELLRVSHIRKLRLRHYTDARPVIDYWAVIVDGDRVFTGTEQEARAEYDRIADLVFNVSTLPPWTTR